MARMVLTAVGRDRPGLVGELTGVLADGGANIIDSRMVNLRGEFAMILLVEAEEKAISQLKTALPAAGSRIGLQMMIGGGEAGVPEPIKGVPYRVKTYSLDQPGLVHRVTEVLRGHGVNIEELTARQESAGFSGEALFIMELRVTVPVGVAVRTVKAELESACAAMNCDLDWEPA